MSAADSIRTGDGDAVHTHCQRGVHSWHGVLKDEHNSGHSVQPMTAKDNIALTPGNGR